MSFSAQWLTLREPYDGAARNPEVLAAVKHAFAGRTSLGIVDLACGTGSTLRTLSPHLPARQDWRLADNDLTLLTQAKNRPAPPGVTITTFPVDLARDVELALDGPIDLVTTSALLDLVSAGWLERLATETAARRLPIYAALSYDGRCVLDPPVGRDHVVVSAVNRHQKGNKGFGPALGPDAAAAAVEVFTGLGYQVTQGLSDWVFGPTDHVIQSEVVQGWAEAAQEIEKATKVNISEWLAHRKSLIVSGTSTIRVGHVDFFAHPTGN